MPLKKTRINRISAGITKKLKVAIIQMSCKVIGNNVIKSRLHLKLKISTGNGAQYCHPCASSKQYARLSSLPLSHMYERQNHRNLAAACGNANNFRKPSPGSKTLWRYDPKNHYSRTNHSDSARAENHGLALVQAANVVYGMSNKTQSFYGTA